VTAVRRQTHVAAPLETVWELVGDPNRSCETGTHTLFKLVGMRDGTFVDVEFGMEPHAVKDRVFDRLAGKRYYSRWLEQSVDALRAATERTRQTAATPDG
jgi:hypothetical protein